MRLRDLYPVAAAGAGNSVAPKIKNRWFWDLGGGKELRLIQVEFGFNQSGGGITETYLTGGMSPDWQFIGLARVEILIPLRPGTESELIATDQATRAELDAATMKIKLFNMEVSNAEVTNGNDISNMKFTFLAIGR